MTSKRAEAKSACHGDAGRIGDTGTVAVGSPALLRLAAEVRACRICAESPMGRALPHEPRPVFRISSRARIGVVGQAPGTRVHASGRPFTDPSGVRLRSWMGVDEATFYDLRRIAVLPMGFCFPGYDAKGGDLPPRRECAIAWRQRILALMPRLEFVLLIGTYAQEWHLPPDVTGGGLTETMRRWRDILGQGGSPRYLPLPHPSWRNNHWLKSNPWFETDVLPVLRREVNTRLD